MKDHEPEITAFVRIGGEPVLRPIIDDFVARMVDDPMIGFHFQGVDRERLARHEYELSASLLGAKVAYAGRPIRDVHAKHPIFGGQFMRRRQLLLEALQRGGVDQAAIDELLAHVDRLRPQVTQEQGSSCLGSADVGPLLVQVPGRPAAAATSEGSDR
jgi:hemoglobin